MEVSGQLATAYELEIGLLLKTYLYEFYLRNLASYQSISDDETVDALCFFCDFIDLTYKSDLNMILELTNKFVEIFNAKKDSPDVM